METTIKVLRPLTHLTGTGTNDTLFFQDNAFNLLIVIFSIKFIARGSQNCC